MESPKEKSALVIKYAKGFNATRVDNAILVEVTYPFQGATSGYTYLLVPRGETAPAIEGATVIQTPVESIVCTSTTHIPLLDYLDETHRLVGFPSTDYVSSEKMRERIDGGEVTDLGVDKGLNIEKLAVLEPDLLMGYTLSSDYGQFGVIEKMGIPVVINAEYLEEHPLGRAEWIKFMSLFFDKAAMADSVFNTIEKNYLDAVSLVSNTSAKPSVLSGIVYGDAWFLPGGRNYAARLFEHAGCNYLWSDNTSTGFLELAFESVYERAHDADLWIGAGTFTSLDQLAAADHRYPAFKPFKTGSVYNYDKRMGPKGGNEFLELGYLRPDLIIKDLIKIAHPDALPDYELFFHRKLK